MKDDEPKKRPEMAEVIQVIRKAYVAANDHVKEKKMDLNNFDVFYKKYHQKKSTKRLGFMRGSKQTSLAFKMHEVLNNCQIGDINQQDAAKKITEFIIENQKKHQGSKFSTASTFNIVALRALPQEIQEQVLKQLNLTIEDIQPELKGEIFKLENETLDSSKLFEVNYDMRKHLASKLNDHIARRNPEQVANVEKKVRSSKNP
jgi:hypothetical protein